MAKYRIEFTKSAKKEFLKLSKKIQSKIIDALNILAINPFSELVKVKKLKGKDALYGIRIGDYRIVYRIENLELVIVVIKIGHRKEVYRD